MATDFYPLIVRSVRRETEDSVVVSFNVEDALKPLFVFVQGQYLTLRKIIGDQDLRRAFSICSGIDDDDLRVGVRRAAGGAFSSWIHDDLAEGDTVEVLPPRGRFFVPLDPLSQRRYLAVAVGSGITPILSIIKSTLSREPSSQFTLIYGNRSLQTTMFREELHDLKDRYVNRFSVHYIFSREEMDASIRSGRLDQNNLSRLFDRRVPPLDHDHIFVCGPDAVKDAVEAELGARGFPFDRFHIERFGAPKVTRPSAPPPAQLPQTTTVTVVKDGIAHRLTLLSHEADLLEIARLHGVELPFSCKSGVCATCRAKIVEGHATMKRNFSLTSAEIDAGFILACQCQPTSEQLVISFDQR